MLIMVKESDIDYLEKLYHKLRVPLEDLSIPHKYDKAITKSFYLPKEQSPLYYRLMVIIKTLGREMTLNKAMAEAIQLWIEKKMPECLGVLLEDVRSKFYGVEYPNSPDKQGYRKLLKRKQRLSSLIANIALYKDNLEQETQPSGAIQFREFLKNMATDYEDLLNEAGYELKRMDREEGS